MSENGRKIFLSRKTKENKQTSVIGQTHKSIKPKDDQGHFY